MGIGAVKICASGFNGKITYGVEKFGYDETLSSRRLSGKIPERSILIYDQTLSLVELS